MGAIIGAIVAVRSRTTAKLRSDAFAYQALALAARAVSLAARLRDDIELMRCI